MNRFWKTTASVLVACLLLSSDALVQAQQSNTGSGLGRVQTSGRAARSRRPAAVHPVSHSVGVSQYAAESILDDGLYQPISDSSCDSCGAVPNQCGCSAASFLLDWSRVDLWLGVTSFTGQGNHVGGLAAPEGQVGGAFGLHQGFNFGAQLPSVLGGQLGSQIGLRFVQTNFEGSTAGNDRRSQVFLTTGLFRRVDYGFQGGMVVDYLHDDWIYQADLLQLRGELGFMLSPCHELGFRFTSSQRTDAAATVINGTDIALQLATLDTYRFYYRFGFGDTGNSQLEMQAGFSEDSSGVWGLTLKTPLQSQLGFQADALVATAPSGSTGAYANEGWTVSMALVWTPGRPFGASRDYYRPLLDVAGNASLLAKRILP